jgi:hypothetical protein
VLVIEKEQNEEKNKTIHQHFVDEWGSIDNISYNENTGKPVPQPSEIEETKN